MMQAEQRADAPERCGPKEHNEAESCESPGRRSLAPRLEHSDESHHEEQNGADGKDFQHKNTLSQHSAAGGRTL
jgi:hypothetical protein